ncbi:SGNH hydrolase domain-containing protein [Caulobacter ginsengisoli]|uniref:SGNH hydrolase domain-containing protein n=1 Tax=Caulobacter ginsengisoli TaxID=400775 RepID=UPI0035204228
MVSWSWLWTRASWLSPSEHFLRRAISAQCKAGFTEDRGEQLARRRDFVAYLNALRARRQGFFLYDPFDPLCGSVGKVCTPVRNGRLIYRDSSHLTEEGSELLAPSFVAFLRDNGLVPAEGRSGVAARP